jgi:hypothetical protein
MAIRARNLLAHLMARAQGTQRSKLLSLQEFNSGSSRTRQMHLRVVGYWLLLALEDLTLKRNVSDIEAIAEQMGERKPLCRQPRLAAFV